MWSESIFAPLQPPRHNIYDVKKVSSVVVEVVSIWGEPGLEMDSFVHEVRTFDRHLPACGKVDQSEVIFMQAVLDYRWLIYGSISHHQLHVMTLAGCV
jgi:hypothetical protein